MKNLKNLVASIATLCILFIFASCQKEDVLVPVSQNPNLESIMQKVEAGQPLSTSEEQFIDEFTPTAAQTSSRGDSILLPTLMGSGSVIEFWPNYLKVNNHGTLGFYFPPADIPALITMKVTWTQNGHLKSKKVHKVIHKMADPYDIWTLYLGQMIKVDYNTIYTATTKGINARGCVKRLDTFGPYNYIPGLKSNNTILNTDVKIPTNAELKMRHFFFVK